MKKWLILAAVACCLAACGGDDDDDDDNGFVAPDGSTCAARTGAYTLKFVEKSGDCGPIPDQIIVSGGGEPDPGCTGGPVDTDTCTITSQIACANGDGTKTELAGQIRWDTNSTRATGTWQFTVTDGANNVLCQSIYDVTATR